MSLQMIKGSDLKPPVSSPSTKKEDSERKTNVYMEKLSPKTIEALLMHMMPLMFNCNIGTANASTICSMIYKNLHMQSSIDILHDAQMFTHAVVVNRYIPCSTNVYSVTKICCITTTITTTVD